MNINNLGLIDYAKAHQIQLETVKEVIAGEPSTIIICHHPPVVTLGKKSDRVKDLMGWEGDIVDIERGGKATYHGPGQIVIYPIINLQKTHDIAGFLGALESAMVNFLAKFGVKSQGNPHRGNPDLTGVWIEDRKIASIGIAVRRWVTYHGLAINIFEDPLAFNGINPCGMQANQMTSLAKETKETLQRQELENLLAKCLTKELSLQNLT